ncbi:hypothetical protein ElyMa_004523500 [Elysia marginata]|uniref:Uncharacterized protein n=1 Tax=Elysia marginata TaxID=1093978 RepID=A0AAV4HR54_9GAST|nr:hypothetical protein ElyMa_004523500 [Elysia marginata]
MAAAMTTGAMLNGHETPSSIKQKRRVQFVQKKKDKEDAEKGRRCYTESLLAEIVRDKTTMMGFLKGVMQKNMMFFTSTCVIEKDSIYSYKTFRADTINEYWRDEDLLDGRDLKIRYGVRGGDYNELKRCFMGYIDSYFSCDKEVALKKNEKGEDIPVGKLKLCYNKIVSDEYEWGSGVKDNVFDDKNISFYLKLSDRVLLPLKKERFSQCNLVIPEGKENVTLSMAVVLRIADSEGGAVTRKVTNDDSHLVFGLSGSNNRKKTFLGRKAVFPDLDTECTMVVKKQQMVCGYAVGKGIRMTAHAVATSKQFKKHRSKSQVKIKKGGCVSNSQERACDRPAKTGTPQNIPSRKRMRDDDDDDYNDNERIKRGRRETTKKKSKVEFKPIISEDEDTTVVDVDENLSDSSE